MGDFDKTIPPQREHGPWGVDDMTLPGKRNQKNEGRFTVGDLILNRYRVLDELGQGGMGVVYKCFDETAGIEVALKALPPELGHNNFEMEDIKENFQLVAKLVHQNIAILKNLEKDNSNGNYYLIMEYCEGEDLRRWIRNKRKTGNLTLEDVIPIVQQIADALDYAHSEKIIHRDIKPGNIMINAAGKIKVLDFGLAAQIHTSMSRVSMVYYGTSGTGPYMAPEQWRGKKQGATSDQYALAVMTYEMLSGDLPFENTDPAVLQQAVLTQEADDISGITRTAQHAIKRAMSKEQEKRFVSCSDFVAALVGKKDRKCSKQRLCEFLKWVAVPFIAVLLSAGGIGYYLFDQQQREYARLEQLAYEKQQRINNILSAVQDAKTKFQWREVLLLSQSVLQLDADNEAAKKIQWEAETEIKKEVEEEKRLAAERKKADEEKRLAAERKKADEEKRLIAEYKKAERMRQARWAKIAAEKANPERLKKIDSQKVKTKNQKASLKFIATVNGECVSAKVKFGHRSFENSNVIFEGFTSGENYSVELSFSHKSVIYVGKVNFVCDWQGERQFHVKLSKDQPLQFTLPGDIPLQMIRIQKGAFIAGSSENDLYHRENEQQQKFILNSDYWLGQFEITQQQWKAVMNTGQFCFIGDMLPADYVSWKDAAAFCERINHLLAAQLPQGYKFDLPTSVQWEYAARGGKWSKGYKFSGSHKIDDVGWGANNSGSRTHKVGSKKPNELGLYDMSGNVAEWCKEEDNSESSDRTLGALRFYKGGSWRGNSREMRLAYKESAYESPNEKKYIKKGAIGFRVALVPDVESVLVQRANYNHIKMLPLQEKLKCSAEDVYKLALKHENEKKLTAKNLFQKAFNAGYYDKNHKLGRIYEQDNEMEDAVRYYETVFIKHKDHEAALQMALIYLRGLNGIVDHVKGKQFLETAAELGNAKAMFNLGCCYAKFRGADFPSFMQSRELAVKWLKKAKQAGVSQAGSILKLLGE